MMNINEDLLQWYIHFLYKKSCGSGVKRKIMPNQCPLELATQELAAKLHKPIMGKFEKRKVYSSFIDSIWGADLADIHL